MENGALRRAVEAFDPTVPIERAWTPPAVWYVDPGFERLERETIWARTWQYAARADQVARPGDFVALSVANEPLVVVRGSDGTLRAFANVCRHKASTVCQGAGRAEELHCPYHGWRYHLDGRLKSAPGLAGIEDFERESMGLTPLGVEEWGPWVFVHADAGAAPLRPQLGALDAALRARGFDGLVHRGTHVWQVACNWKSFCDNYLDGGYHIPNMHPTLDAQLAMDGYRTELFERFNVQTAPASDGANAGLELDPARRIGSGAIYAWIYPNFMINRYGPVLDVNVVRPTGPESCEVTFEWWFERGCDDAFVAASIAQSKVTQEEDVLISRRVQEGLRSRHYSVGRYAPRRETGIHHFHRLLAGDLRAGLR